MEYRFREREMLHFSLPLVNRLNKTESAIFTYLFWLSCFLGINFYQNLSKRFLKQYENVDTIDDVFQSVSCIYFQSYNFTADDLKDLGEIGRGNYGTVNKMLHEKSETIMSVKVSYKILRLL